MDENLLCVSSPLDCFPFQIFITSPAYVKESKLNNILVAVDFKVPYLSNCLETNIYCAFNSFQKVIIAHLKNGTYYVTGYGVRLSVHPSVNFFVYG